MSGRRSEGGDAMTTVRDRALEVLRELGSTTLFTNPGSTEITLLGDLPDDFHVVLGLHEGAVVAMATGWAIGHDRPGLAVLHTTAGLGNAVGAIATARASRVPLVVVVGQQDRRHLALEPFLAGHLGGLAGSYPVWTGDPARAVDVPGALRRAWHEARDGRGPAIVVVPMDDWGEAMGDEVLASPARLRNAIGVDSGALDELIGLLAGAASPALVVGAGAASEATWAALVGLAEQLDCPVFQEAFGARPGFPQDHRLFCGILPSARGALRERLGPYDLVVAVGAPVFRQYPYVPGPLVPATTRLAVVSDDATEAHHSAADLAVVGPLPALCEELRRRVPARTVSSEPPRTPAETPGALEAGRPMRAVHVLSALARRLPADVVLVEEAPSARPALHRLLPARTPLGFVAAAGGGLGFALPAAAGLRMALPGRPVVAVVGDGASLYTIQALWSAAYYEVGVLVVVIANGGYAVMDRLVEQAGRKRSWPSFEAVSTSAIAAGFGCPSRRAEGLADLEAILDEVVPTLARAKTPLLLEAVVEADPEFVT